MRFGRSGQNYFYQPHAAVQMGMDSGGRSWLVTGRKEKSATNRERDTRWMGPGLNAGRELQEKGWPSGTKTRDLPPWRWRTDADRTMEGQSAEGDGQPVGDHEQPRAVSCRTIGLRAHRRAVQRRVANNVVMLRQRCHHKARQG